MTTTDRPSEAASPPAIEQPPGLRRMKAIATSMLVIAAIVFVIAKRAEADGGTWVGYVRATAEAAMVGALADWFAVTALFRHPLGIPIPHTAIIQKRKDEIGESLGSFVRDNFLTREIVSGRLADAALARKVGEWAAEPTHARQVGDQLGASIRGVTEILSDEELSTELSDQLASRARAVPVAPLLGRVVDEATSGEYHQQLLESTLTGLSTFMDENRVTFRKRLYNESPWWVPEQVDDVVFDKIYDVVSRFLADVGRDRDHELRRSLDERAAGLAVKLKEDPALAARAEQYREELLAHPEVRAWSESLWLRLKDGLVTASTDPDSDLRQRIDGVIADGGARVAADPELQAKLDQWIIAAVGHVADQFRDEVADLIASTVQRWDAAETADRLEAQVGKDLQFIRINGTVVGGLAGFVIHAVGELLT